MGTIDGPYFEDLYRGQRFEGGPGLTLTEGLAAAHQAIVGGRSHLFLDHGLSRRVAGGDAALAAPNLVWDVAIGQSTLVTHTVVANLFYRGVVFRRAPRLGDTLRTVTEVVGLRQNSRRAGRAATGLAALRISTVDQEGRRVLDFWRCAMLPLRDQDADTGHADDLSVLGADPGHEDLAAVASGWDLGAFREAVPGRHFAGLAEGEVFEVVGGDVVTSAPELARLTLNVAKVHHDARASGQGRLVYGGHTIGLALHQAVRALPELVTVVGWHGCDHVGPVREGDTLASTVEVERTEPLAEGGLAHLRSRVRAVRDGGEPAEVLDWRFVALFA
ncbi:acyl dehydratase [Actinomadura hallensis]|uniref:Acyl dehydratase n=1 Tax=Actinomadura hallensis TaxID=337895 RepID=A0A543IGA4_9ACTN|nr:MaoC family dehydratase [Actinomadura hallensis]TQM69616.1 acyl dehydratase [Actinomadura hallensis]HLV73246.1 MaoC family dehydratase [Vulgatibacteraceae bacterium]